MVCVLVFIWMFIIFKAQTHNVSIMSGSIKCDNMPRCGGERSSRVASVVGRLADYQLSTLTSVSSVFSTQPCAEDIGETRSRSRCIQPFYHPTDRCVTDARHSDQHHRGSRGCFIGYWCGAAFNGLKCDLWVTLQQKGKSRSYKNTHVFA